MIAENSCRTMHQINAVVSVPMNPKINLNTIDQTLEILLANAALTKSVLYLGLNDLALGV